MPVPTGKDDLRLFLGFVTYPSKFIPNLSEIDAPLRQVLKSDVLFTWQSTQAKAFQKLSMLAALRLSLNSLTSNNR